MLNNKSHVLVVGDNAAEIYPLVDALRTVSYRLTMASDGIQAYAQAVSMVPDIILMNVRLSRRDGIATIRLLKANPTTEDIPVLFLAANATLEDRLKGLRSGAVDYISKPFEIEEMVEKVRIHLSLRQKTGSASAKTSITQTHLWPNVEGPSKSTLALQRAAATLIHDRLANPPRTSELATLLAVSERRILAAFKSSVGMSVSEYIRRERMHRAANLLTQTDLHILDIVAEVGYSSAANFSTAFRQYWNRTPSDYRAG